ncbi:hypothetical protein HYU95_01060 [Candidatus Daviesbacteria bacterium]|nr:hypothetical protein [Candidatus Daviesbacteria bacterium]
MILKKLAPPPKIFLSLVINAVFFGGIFALSMFGLTTGSILVILAAAVSLEVIYITISIQASINKQAQSFTDMEKHIEKIKESEEKAHTILIYMGHQMRATQHELDTLRKSGILKSNGNGHHPKARA